MGNEASYPKIEFKKHGVFDLDHYKLKCKLINTDEKYGWILGGNGEGMLYSNKSTAETACVEDEEYCIAKSISNNPDDY